MTRNDAIAYFKRYIDLYCVDGISREAEEMAIKALEQQKTGHWIIIDDCERFIAKCSECGQIEDSRMISKHLYCPNCGAKMESEDKECI